jgi:aminopeptidase N
MKHGHATQLWRLRNRKKRAYNLSNMIFRLFRPIIIFCVFIAIPSLAQKPYAPASPRVRTYDVQHYIIRSRLDFAKKQLLGQTTILLKPLAKGFKTFDIDAAEMKIESVTLGDQNTPLAFDAHNNKITITLDREYSPAEQIAVDIKYTVSKPKKGFHIFDESRDKARRLNYPQQAWTQGQAEENRYWFPGYDYPDDKVTSEQYVTAPAKDVVAANGELLETADNGDGTKTWHYKMTVPHASYLISFVAGDYVKFDDKYENVPLGYYIYRGEEKLVKPAFGRTAVMMEIYEKLTGVKFPYNKYDQIMIAQFDLGGMENITATTLADSEIFGAELNSLRPGVEELIAHELAHSWFGDLVTCKTWPQLWLNEGFATYMVAIYKEQTMNRNNYLLRIREDARHYFSAEQSGEKPHALVNDTFKQPDDDIFDTTTYQKGSVVLHMLREAVGDEAFWRGVNLYLTRNRFGSVETADLQKAMEDASRKDLDWFFNEWAYSAGYPVLAVKSSYDAGRKNVRLEITQTQKQRDHSVAAFTLPIDIEVETAAGTVKKKITLNKTKQVFDIEVKEAPKKIWFDKDEKIMLKKFTFSGDVPIESVVEAWQ